MLTLELCFLAGRFHATPWGRHVNEGIPEWPPSPFRLVRSLVDIWLRRRPEWGAERVEPILRALSCEPPLFHLPPARASHTRSFLSENAEDASKRQLVFDAFAVTREPVLMAWPSVELTPQQAQDLQDLLAAMNYLGRSESWIQARIVSSGERDWNCRPHDRAGEREEPVLVACPRSVAVEVGSNGKSRKKVRGESGLPPWLDSLCWTTAELAQAGLSAPPSLEMVPYTRRRDCFQGRTHRTRARELPGVQCVTFRLESRVPPLAIHALRVAEKVRTMVMGSYRRVTGSSIPSWKFSGKVDGTPAAGHAHAHFLALDLDRDGKLDHLAVVCPAGLGSAEQAALDTFSAHRKRPGHLWQEKGRPDIFCVPLDWARESSELSHFRPACRMASVTPFLPARHYRKGRGSFDEWLENEVRLELERRGLPAPSSIRRMPHLPLRSGLLRWLDFTRSRKTDTPRMGFGFSLEFAEPVPGPVCLGYGCHFGLGLFLPESG